MRIAKIAQSFSALALLGATLSHALVGDWTSFTHLEEINDLETARGRLFVATGGGIRTVEPDMSEKVYRNTEGLRDVGVRALASGPDGEVYAASQLGYLYRYAPGTDDWEILGTSYRAAGWKMNKRAMEYRSGYLVLGSEKGLSFFNVKKKIADANVSKMGGSSGLSVNGILFVGDTLFAGTNKGIFKSVLHLDRLMTDPKINIFNPGIWSLVPGSAGALFYDPTGTPGDTAFTRDSAKVAADIIGSAPDDFDNVLLAHGFLKYGPGGITSEYSGGAYGKARASKFGKILVDGEVHPNPFHMEVLASYRGVWYMGSQSQMCRFYSGNGGPDGFDLVINRESLPLGEFTSIRANRNGVFSWGNPNVYTLDGRTWKTAATLSIGYDAAEAERRGLHTLSVTGKSAFFVGSWGSGFHAWINGEEKVFDAKTSCIPSAVEADPNYPALMSQAIYKDKGIWIGIFLDKKKYRIGYYDLAKGTTTCFEPNTNEEEPKDLQIVGDTLVVVTERGVDAFAIEDGGSSVALNPVNRLAGLETSGKTPLVGKMDRRGNFWVTTEGSDLLYIPSVAFKAETIQSLKALEGFSGTSCFSLDIDPQGHLWAGCREGGVLTITPGRDSLSHAFSKLGLNDGLLSESIYHLDVNQDNGDVWVATEKGVSRFESASRPDRTDLSGIKVFPNPFLAKHEKVVFDKLTPGSEIQVLTQSGSVVYHARLAAGSGDQIQWNGRNQAGERVREGVYFYVVRSSKESKNGKLIIAR
ncbi:MAG: hypothetical protein JWP91_1467 [Fibrobacteres bacterium]|nr:hypothetical protein [Fibrobacterota bacterium]